jgi:hypothetical protein
MKLIRKSTKVSGHSNGESEKATRVGNLKGNQFCTNLFSSRHHPLRSEQRGEEIEIDRQGHNLREGTSLGQEVEVSSSCTGQTGYNIEMSAGLKEACSRGDLTERKSG